MKKNNLKMFETLSDYIQKHQSGGIVDMSKVGMGTTNLYNKKYKQ